MLLKPPFLGHGNPSLPPIATTREISIPELASNLGAGNTEWVECVWWGGEEGGWGWIGRSGLYADAGFAPVATFGVVAGCSLAVAFGERFDHFSLGCCLVDGLIDRLRCWGGWGGGWRED